MAGKRRVTREVIIETARRRVAEDGTAALTFQAIAGALGVSKQAIIYWYPSRAELIRDFCLPVLAAEREATSAAIADATTGAEAVERHVRALVAFHLGDLNRFRMMYLRTQLEPDFAPTSAGEAVLLDPIHQTTSAAYDLLEARIAADAAYRGAEDPRTLAVAVDMAAIGLVTMLAMAEAIQDPWKQSPGELLDALVALLARPAPRLREPRGQGSRPTRTAATTAR